MYQHKHCQMQTEDGLLECGFLLGAKCTKDPNNPIWVSNDATRLLKIVGCASWSRYMEYDNGRTNQMQKLPISKVE